MFKITVNGSKGGHRLQCNDNGDFNILLSSVDRSTREKGNKETMLRIYAKGQMDLVHIYRIFLPQLLNTYYFHQYVEPMKDMLGHMPGHKTGFSKFKNLENIRCAFLISGK